MKHILRFSIAAILGLISALLNDLTNLEALAIYFFFSALMVCLVVFILWLDEDIRND